MTDNPKGEPMTSTELEVHRPAASVAITDQHYLASIPAFAERMAKSSLCIEQFKGKPEDIEIAGYGLADNGIRLSFSTLAQVFVIKGRPGYMAQIQTAMAAMHGIDLHPIDSRCNDESATVEMIMPNGRRYEVTFTWAEAKKAKLDENPSKQYQLRPGNMLVARAMTRAIDRHCPAVKLGLGGSINMLELGAINADSEPVAEPAEDDDPMVPAGRAKNELVRRYEAKGLTHRQAIAMAALLWSSHMLKSEPIAKSRFDRILTAFDEQPARPEPSVGVVAPETTGGPPLDDGPPLVTDEETGEILQGVGPASADDWSLFDDPEAPFE